MTPTSKSTSINEIEINCLYLLSIWCSSLLQQVFIVHFVWQEIIITAILHRQPLRTIIASFNNDKFKQASIFINFIDYIY